MKKVNDDSLESIYFVGAAAYEDDATTRIMNMHFKSCVLTAERSLIVE
jgi:hypothetical protein